MKRGDVLVLQNINLFFKGNENVGIVGENASGKSTLLDVLAGRLFPFQGKIEKQNGLKVILVPRDYSFHRVLGAAFQYYQQRYQAYDSELGPTLWEVLQNQAKPVGTVDEKSVDLPPLAYSEVWVQEVADLMHIRHLLDRKITSLSNGETRRSLLAYSILQKPDLLLLDNPTTGLDVESRERLKRTLEGLSVPYVLVGSLKDMPENIDRLVHLKAGQVEQIYARPFPESIFENKSFRIDPEMMRYFGTADTEDFAFAVELKNGTVDYGEKRVLDGVNWNVKRGEKWALLGANGSGKTTLLSLITADNPKSYQNELSLFDRRRGSGESIWEIKRKIGFVSPELHIFFPKNSTVYKVVASGLFDTMGLFRKLNADQEEKTERMLAYFGLTHLKERLLKNLSTGEQRQVLLARALIKNPPLLLLDEACQGLDYQHMVYFRDLINELAEKLNKTLIYVTHQKEEIPACVGKILHLDAGKVL
ncbi:ATP-binding cassette domain-containing protein [Marinilongibacter aquaticus]|uniref:ATP-binding cassette domain-containing protein n=1 Tax=Marinilongibacter aquaticus TaxID=2975157 RepID=UPI0021BD4B83|nr:ATP-binding cassette domain-containing protein [Marinilongibacter aquaticus]UBM57582.1 ATP-binding cassette domain-containing protein [Marinilongibacter aquaticus]